MDSDGLKPIPELKSGSRLNYRAAGGLGCY
jgi:hypothetical protein